VEDIPGETAAEAASDTEPASEESEGEQASASWTGKAVGAAMIAVGVVSKWLSSGGKEEDAVRGQAAEPGTAAAPPGASDALAPGVEPVGAAQPADDQAGDAGLTPEPKAETKEEPDVAPDEAPKEEPKVEPMAEAEDESREALKAELRNELREELKAELRDALREELRQVLRDELRAALKDGK
jgi:hypothetical protein